MQKETNKAVVNRMTCKIGLIWRHMKTLYWKIYHLIHFMLITWIVFYRKAPHLLALGHIGFISTWTIMAAPFETHSPPVEDLPYAFHRGSIDIKWISSWILLHKISTIYPLCGRFNQNTAEEVWLFNWSYSTRESISKSFTGVVWFQVQSNGKLPTASKNKLLYWRNQPTLKFGPFLWGKKNNKFAWLKVVLLNKFEFLKMETKNFKGSFKKLLLCVILYGFVHTVVYGYSY